MKQNYWILSALLLLVTLLARNLAKVRESCRFFRNSSLFSESRMLPTDKNWPWNCFFQIMMKIRSRKKLNKEILLSVVIIRLSEEFTETHLRIGSGRVGEDVRCYRHAMSRLGGNPFPAVLVLLEYVLSASATPKIVIPCLPKSSE